MRVVCVDNPVTGSVSTMETLIDHPATTFVEAGTTDPLPTVGEFNAVVNPACPASPADFGPPAVVR